MAFFQGALLAGYGYAHVLQRIAALAQAWLPPRGASSMPAGAPTQVVLIAKTPQALAPFAADPRWRPARNKNVRPWTDTYTNVAGALLDQLLQR